MSDIEPRRKTLKGIGPWAPIPGWLITHPEITSTALRIYAVLALLSSAEESTAFPSRRKLADMMGCTTKTVDRGLDVLEMIGAIKVTHRRRPNSREWTSSLYEVILINPAREVATQMSVPTEMSLPSDINVATLETLTTPPSDINVAAEQEPLNQNHVNKNQRTNVDLAPESTTSIRSANRRDPLFDAICEVCEVNVAEITPTHRGPLNRARAELANVGATPDEVRVRARRYGILFERAALTAPALAKHWASLSTEPKQRTRGRDPNENRHNIERVVDELASLDSSPLQLERGIA